MLAIISWLAVGSNPTTRLIASLAECALYGKMAVENQGCECVGGIKVCKKRLFPNAPILGRKEKTMNNYVKYIKVADAVRILFGDCIRYVFPTTAEPTTEFIKLNNAVDLLQIYPSEDVEPVVRCKDCKWFDKQRRVCHNPRYGDGYANYQPPDTNDEYWCADGERGDDE